MRFKTLLLLVATAIPSVLGACDQPAGPAASGVAVEQKSGATSAIDLSTGEPVALNYRQVGTVVTIPGPGASSGSATQAIDQCTSTFYYPGCSPECDPMYQVCEPTPCNPNDPYGGCYTPPCTPLISSYMEHRLGNDPMGPIEASGKVSSNCGYLVLTGIGARISGDDYYTTLHLRGRRMNPDGSWGETVNYRFGSDPNHSLEAWGEVPSSATDFYGIVGVSVSQDHVYEDVRTLVIFYRKIALTASGVRAIGPTYQSRFGVDPNNPWFDVQYVTNGDNQVMVGAGFRSVDGERTATMAAYVGILP